IRKQMKRSGNPATAFERDERLYVFMLQAGWTDHAEKDLDDMIQRYPAQRKKLEELREGLQRLIAAQYVEGMEHASKVGQHEDAQERAERFFAMKLEQAARGGSGPGAGPLRARYGGKKKKLKEARRFLEALGPAPSPPLHGDLYKEIVTTLLAELNHDTLPRLETFLGQAADAE